MRWVKTILVLLLLVVVFGAVGGWILIRDNAQRSDAIVVLEGGTGDARYLKALDLLRSNYAKVLFLDARTDTTKYGHTPAEFAAAYLKESAPDLGDRVRVCLIENDGTKFEIKYVAKCLESVGAKSALLVTSDYHTTRALSAAKVLAPQYQWTVAASHNESEFNWKWWQRREWAKRFVGEWERLIWWELVERWGK